MNNPSVSTLKGGYKAMLTFAFDNRKKELILSHCEGHVSREMFQKSLQQCKEASQVIFDFYKTAIRRKFSKELWIHVQTKVFYILYFFLIH